MKIQDILQLSDKKDLTNSFTGLLYQYLQNIYNHIIKT